MHLRKRTTRTRLVGMCSVISLCDCNVVFPLARFYIHQTLCSCKLNSQALYKELLISVTYLVCAVYLTDTANNVFVGKD